jgi:oxidoreductase
MPGRPTADGPVRVTLVGLGWAGSNIWAPRLTQHPAFELAAVVDPDPAARARVAAATGAAAYEDAAGLPAGQADLAVVAAPNHLHAPLASRLLAQGIPVFMEKPVCLTTGQARVLADAEAAGGAVLLAGSAARYRADIGALCVLARSLGEIRHLDLAWTRARGIPQGRGWFTRRRLAGGGALVDLGWHLLDVGFLLLGPVTVRQVIGTVSADFIASSAWRADWRDDAPPTAGSSAPGDVEDTARIFVVTDTGAGISMRVSWASHQASDLTQITVEGTAGTARLACTFGFSPDRLPRPVLTVLRGGIEEEVPLPAEPVGSEYARQLDALPALLADPGQRGQGVADAARMIDVIERLYRSARLPASTLPPARDAGASPSPAVALSADAAGRPGPATVRQPAGTTAQQAVTTGGIGQLRAALVSAARGECFVLHARLAASDDSRAAGYPPVLAGARMAMLDALALAYGSGQAVVSVLEADSPGPLGPADGMPWLAVLSRLTRLPSQDRDELALVQRWLAQLDRQLPVPAARSAVIGHLGRALALAGTYGTDTQAIGQAVRGSTFVAAPWALAAGPGLVRTGPHGELYAAGAHAVAVSEADLAAGGPVPAVNPVVVDTGAVTSLVQACARLDPDRQDGQLLLSVAASMTDWPRLGTLAGTLRREGHRPAWVCACPAAPDIPRHLRTTIEVLGEQGLHLAGVSTTTGRHLEHVVDIAQFLMARSPAGAAWPVPLAAAATPGSGTPSGGLA